MRLAHALVAAGFLGVVLPRCARCGKPRPDLGAPRPQWRVCHLLDTLPPTRTLYLVRERLIEVGVLPERAEYLDRIPVWMNESLADKPTVHAHTIRTFAHWSVLRRARRRALGRPVTPDKAQRARTLIVTAFRFLEHLHAHALALNTATQADLETWVVGQPNRTARAPGPFLAYARSRALCADLRLPTRAPDPDPALPPDEDHQQQLERCLTDKTMPLTTRTIGARCSTARRSPASRTFARAI